MSQKTDTLQFGTHGLRQTPVANESYAGLVNIGADAAVVTLTCYRGDASIPATIAVGGVLLAPISTWAVTSGTVAGIIQNPNQ